MGPVTDLGLARRLLYLTISVGGTLIYVASFAGSRDPEHLLRVARAVGIASAISWPVFGLALLSVTRGRPSILDWVDACLATQAAGSAVLFLSVLLNLLRVPAPDVLHALVITLSNGTMLCVFVAQARDRGMNSRMALFLWITALNGTFLLLLPFLMG